MACKVTTTIKVCIYLSSFADWYANLKDNQVMTVNDPHWMFACAESLEDIDSHDTLDFKVRSPEERKQITDFCNTNKIKHIVMITNMETYSFE